MTAPLIQRRSCACSRSATVTSHHSVSTRLLHAALASAVGVQLVTSLIMQVPSAHHSGNVFFEVHKNSGILAAVLVLLFWAVIATRGVGTEVGLLFPEFSANRRTALASDVRRHWSALRHGQLPGFQDASPLVAAGHGLGLVLVTVMVATGGVWEGLRWSGAFSQPVADRILELHSLTSVFVWAYLIGHGLMALRHHYAGDQNLASMWSLRTSTGKDGAGKDA